ncbi:MAG: hypothetical protein APG12_00011 [Candidatus Methanofastidiosum methylothiophilum]|uniref:Uncharacterized protein n=1 Tax=Candidatus Methanofastidiosum methylothiophilum TaxID=1705564 RepID=A0A150J296_9EURY|nr:MAG: hypothetical protein APG10_01400 [Candidatus Methanofastidiosum methylthiophilus]KYC48702.1 MAG: hypothetical protein APG11_00012 [Candidatus Methanofastidiosum methylthiophilus]KYC51350.1 MAG: hypothetical protein APG12_00011 [Candidatus Methanofastidiosum methylthiophilus]
MKKIFAIVISLLFVVSVFGVSQTTAYKWVCEEEYYKISAKTAKVGETFTISLSTEFWTDYSSVKIGGLTIDEVTSKIVLNGGLPYRIGPVEIIGVDYYGEDGALIYSGLVLPDCGFGFPCWSELNPSWPAVRWIKWTFRAVTPGTLILNGVDYCNDTETVTILSKDLPFKFFAKLFGFGKKD